MPHPYGSHDPGHESTFTVRPERHDGLEAHRVEPIHVAVINVYDWCMEIEAAVLYSFTTLPHVQVHNFNPVADAAQMEFLTMINPHAHHREWQDLMADPHAYRLFIFVDWYPVGHSEWSPRADQLMSRLLEPEYTGNIVITLHEPKQLPWDPEVPGFGNMSEVFRDDRVHLYGITPHMATVIEGLAATGVHKPAFWYAPVFPWRRLACHANETHCGGTRRGFIVQGALVSFRRDYDRLFRDLLQKPEVADRGDLEISLVGRGSLVIPEQLADKVKIVPDLNQKVGSFTAHARDNVAKTMHVHTLLEFGCMLSGGLCNTCMLSCLLLLSS